MLWICFIVDLSPFSLLSLFFFFSIFQFSGEYERVQKKAFTNWVNSHLIKVSQTVNSELSAVEFNFELQ